MSELKAPTAVTAQAWPFIPNHGHPPTVNRNQATRRVARSEKHLAVRGSRQWPQTACPGSMRSCTAAAEPSVPTEPRRKELPYRKLDEGSQADDSDPDRTKIAVADR